MLTSLQRKILQVCTVAAATREAKRSYHTSEVRGRSWEDPMPEGWWPGGVTPSLRSGAVAKSARLQWHRNGREELPWVWGQGSRMRGDTPWTRSGAVAGPEELPHAPMPEARGGASGRRSGGPIPHPRSSDCPGAGGPRGAISQWRLGRVAVGRYPSSKVRSNGCALLEQPWRYTLRPR